MKDKAAGKENVECTIHVRPDDARTVEESEALQLRPSHLLSIKIETDVKEEEMYAQEYVLCCLREAGMVAQVVVAHVMSAYVKFVESCTSRLA